MPFKDEKVRKAYNKEWYQKHKQEVMDRKKKRQRKILEWFRAYKSSLCCMDCEVRHPAVLQFHHRNREEKSFTLSSIISKAISIKRITDEINKCDVLCANCHAKRHWREVYASDSWLEILNNGDNK